MFVLPVEEDNPTRHRHYALWALIAANTVVFLPTWLLTDHLQFFQTYGLVPAHPSLVTAYTSMFLHAGWMHLLGNMLFLMMFGDNIEDVIGPVLFLLAYFLGGFAAVFSYLPLHSASTIPLVGASGAISAVVGMYLVFFPYAKADLVIYFLRWEITAIPTTIIGAVAAWFAEQLALMLFAEFTSLGQFVRVAFSAHVGGFLAGAACGLLFVTLGYVRRYVANAPRNRVFGYVTQPPVSADAPAPRAGVPRSLRSLRAAEPRR
jgi:membrane associated rhomboid family serine protease